MTRETIIEALQTVTDPEIPTISLVDMGIITGVEIRSADDVKITMTPTFVGCPAISVMRADAEAAVRGLGINNVEVEVNFDEPWTTNRLTEAGRAALLKHGLAPPEPFDNTIVLNLDILHETACPYCNSKNTEMRSPFGPTLCRSLHYCNNCLQAFEGFKPI